MVLKVCVLETSWVQLAGSDRLGLVVQKSRGLLSNESKSIQKKNETGESPEVKKTHELYTKKYTKKVLRSGVTDLTVCNARSLFFAYPISHKHNAFEHRRPPMIIDQIETRAGIGAETHLVRYRLKVRGCTYMTWEIPGFEAHRPIPNTMLLTVLSGFSYLGNIITQSSLVAQGLSYAMRSTHFKYVETYQPLNIHQDTYCQTNVRYLL